MRSPDIIGGDAGDAGVDCADVPAPVEPASPQPESGGRGGLDPVRYGDWEKNGRCIDF